LPPQISVSFIVMSEIIGFVVSGIIVLLLVVVLLIQMIRKKRSKVGESKNEKINKEKSVSKTMKSESMRKKKITKEGRAEIREGKKLIRRNKRENKKALRETKRHNKEKREIEDVKDNIVEEKSVSKLYGIFFRRILSKEALAIVEKYGLKVENVGSTPVCLFKSTKNPELKLLSLVNLIVDKSSNKDLLVHSVDLSSGEKNVKSFPEVRSSLNRFRGILVSDSIYQSLEDKKMFSHIGNFRGKENLIKLYRFN